MSLSHAARADTPDIVTRRFWMVAATSELIDLELGNRDALFAALRVATPAE